MGNDILGTVIERTQDFLLKMSKDIRKKKGQFFTSAETARYMAAMFDLELLPETVNILDPGSGSGILSAAIVERLNETHAVKAIHLTCYETDPLIQPLLVDNLKEIKVHSTIPLEFEVRAQDYILSQQHDFEEDLLASPWTSKYDLVIANPPYLRVARNDATALAMPSVVHGAPNLYFLFAAMSLFNLKDDAEMVYIIPRSWTSGLYFRCFRRYLLEKGKLVHVHLFVSRDEVFSEDDVLQETIIVKVKKTARTPERVLVTSSQGRDDFKDLALVQVPYSLVDVGKDHYVFLPTSDEEMQVIQKIHFYNRTLPELGLRMRTGIVVDFRQWNELRKAPGEHIVPLFYSHHICDGRVHHHSSGKGFEWIVDAEPSLVQRNKNYVFCKRFTSKEEPRRLQCGIYLAADFAEFKDIGTQNKINYVDCVDGTEMELPIVYGVYALLNSTLFDMYYRVLNGSTQVNSSEVNNIPVPPMEMVEQIGRMLILAGDLTTKCCDDIVKEVAYG